VTHLVAGRHSTKIKSQAVSKRISFYARSAACRAPAFSRLVCLAIRYSMILGQLARSRILPSASTGPPYVPLFLHRMKHDASASGRGFALRAKRASALVSLTLSHWVSSLAHDGQLASRSVILAEPSGVTFDDLGATCVDRGAADFAVVRSVNHMRLS
jgi:hypothetical protein